MRSLARRLSVAVAAVAATALAAPVRAEAPGPPGAPPAEPPTAQPAPPAEASPPAAVQESESPPGQWVYTSQYGWVWMPYGDPYTFVPSDGSGDPYEYVYAPAFGWEWVVAPWIWGWGPWPFFGDVGPIYFGWYGHGWWRHPEHFHFHDPGGWRGGRFGGRGWTAPGRGFRTGPVTRSFAGAPGRPGFARPGAAHPGLARGGFSRGVPVGGGFHGGGFHGGWHGR